MKIEGRKGLLGIRGDKPTNEEGDAHDGGTNASHMVELGMSCWYGGNEGVQKVPNFGGSGLGQEKFSMVHFQPQRKKASKSSEFR